MFSGTVRSNLDPFGEYGADAILWEAVRDVGLEEQVGTAPGFADERRAAPAGAGLLGGQAGALPRTGGPGAGEGDMSRLLAP